LRIDSTPKLLGVSFMAKKIATFLAVLIVAIALWGLLFENNSTIILINGQEVGGPLKGVIGAGGMVVALIALIGLAILMALAFAGTGFFIFGGIIVGGLIYATFMFPFLFPMLIPLILIWAFIAIFKK